MSDIKIFADSPEDEAVDQIYELANKVYELINQAAPEDAEIKMISNSNTTKIDMSGLDKDTEILTPNGWLKINQYENQNILTYEPQTNNATFEKPKAYIKLPCSTFFHYANSKGMNQMISKEHTMLVYKGYKAKGFETTMLHPNELNQLKLNKGYYTTKTTFQANNKGVDLTDTELRLRVMIQADGNIKRGRIINMHFAKERKIERCINLLKEANIDYKIAK